jgi:hypothetical protein
MCFSEYLSSNCKMQTWCIGKINFVSFAAPIATLAMMEQRGASDRHLAATLAMVFAIGPGPSQRQPAAGGPGPVRGSIREGPL